MQTHFSPSSLSQQPVSLGRGQCPAPALGSVAELVFSEDQPAMMQLMLLPLLQQLSLESRWQLWLTPQQKLSREWLKSAGLPLEKVMQIQQAGELTPFEAMNKALRTGNYSVVIGWIHEPLSRHQRNILEESAKSGQGLGLILRASLPDSASGRPSNGLKIPSSLYH